MPCSAVEWRRQGSSLPVSIVRPGLDSDLRSKYSDSYLRRSSLSRTTPSDRTTDYSRYTTSRMLGKTKAPVGPSSRPAASSSSSTPLTSHSSTSHLKPIPSTSAPTKPSVKTTPAYRTSVLSRSEETRSSSRVESQAMATRPPRKPITSFDVAEFRSFYSPDSYVIGSSSRSSEQSKCESSGYSSRSESYSRESSGMSYSRDSLASSRGDPSAPHPRATASRLPTKQPPEGPPPPPPEENLEPRIGSKGGVVSSSSQVARKEPDSRDTNGLNGLRNIGNTCFLNSVVQCLSNTRLLKDYLINKDYVSDINAESKGGALIKSFAEVLCELWGGEGRIVNTSVLKSQVQKYAPRFMGYSQQDAQEFLRYLLQGIHDDVNRVVTRPRNLPPVDDNLPDREKAVECWRQYLRYDDSRVVDLFVGQLKSTLRCTVCGHCSTTFEVFWDLSLPLPSRSGTLRLAQCLEHFTKEEVLDHDEMPTCSKCKTRRKCTKSFSIHKFPKILVLHLKRFSPSERYRKLSATVEFPLTGLDMSEYGGGGPAPTYSLYAVSNHSGTAYSGHYTAYCLHPHARTWHEYNDSRVSSISARNVVSSEAYILFYEQATGSTSVTSRL